jgi:alginate O-acetyltransferase complex protein AlgI
VWRVKAESWSYAAGILVTMFLCGLWHGASWSFIVWGLWQGGLMLLERFRLRRWLKKRWIPLQHLYALLAIGIGWVFFRSPTLGYALEFLKAMAGFGTGAAPGYGPSFFANGELIFFAVVGLVGALPFLPRLQSGLSRIGQNLNPQASSIWRRGSILLSHAYCTLVLLASVMAIAGGTHTPFIYFRF